MGAEVVGECTCRGSGGCRPPDADNNMAITHSQIAID